MNEVAEEDFHRIDVSKICANSQKYPINCTLTSTHDVKHQAPTTFHSFQ